MSTELIIPDIPECCTRIKLDVGLSNEAGESACWLAKQPDLFVFGFEPLPSAIRNVMNYNGQDPCHMQRKWHSRFFPYQVALSDRVCEKELIVNGYDTGCSSFFKPKKGSFLDIIKAKINVPCWTLDYWFQAFEEKYGDRFPHIDHIKIDAQGEDLKILKGAKHWLCDKVAWVSAEADGCYYEDCDFNDRHLNEYMVGELDWERVNHPRCTDPTYLNPKFSHMRDVYIMQDTSKR